MTPGYLDEVDRAIETLHPDSWKGLHDLDPIFLTKKGSSVSRREAVYLFYERPSIRHKTICIHRSCPPTTTSWAGSKYATVWDLGKAKDWPQLTFVIYHSALRPFTELPDQSLGVRETGRIDV
jgi:hypothetical protein